MVLSRPGVPTSLLIKPKKFRMDLRFWHQKIKRKFMYRGEQMTPYKLQHWSASRLPLRGTDLYGPYLRRIGRVERKGKRKRTTGLPDPGTSELTPERQGACPLSLRHTDRVEANPTCSIPGAAGGSKEQCR